MGSSKKHKEKEKDRDPEDRHREHKKHRHKDRDKEKEKDRDREKRKRSRSRERSSRGAERDRSGRAERSNAEPRVKKERLDPAFEDNSEPGPKSAGGDASLSIEETNKLRAKLGLKPLDLNENKKETGTKEEPLVAETINPVHIKQQAEIREKLAALKEKRLLNKKLGKVKALGDDEPWLDDTAAWVERSRKLAKEKELAEKRAKLLEEMDEEFGVSNLVEQEFAQEKRDSYGSRHLKGLKVQHKMDSFREGETVVLTLQDKGVLEEKEDVLVNVGLVDKEKAEKNVELKKKKPDYKPYEEEESVDDMLVLKPKSVLSKYDEEIEGEKKKSFRLSSGGFVGGERERELQAIRENLHNQAQSLDMPSLSLATEYYTPQEMVGFKKTKRKVKKIRKKERAGDLLIDDTRSTDFGSRSRGRGRRQDEEEEEGAEPGYVALETSSKPRDVLQQSDDIRMADMDISDEEDFVSPEPTAFEEDEAEQELQKQLEKQRKLRQKQMLKDSGERVAEHLKQMETAEDDENDPDKRNNIVFNATSEFCRTLGDIPTYGLSGNREDQEDIMDFEKDVEKEGGGQSDSDMDDNVGWSTVNLDEEKVQADFSTASTTILDEEPIVNSGLSAALLLCKNKGLLDTQMLKVARVKNPKPVLANDNYCIEDKMNIDDKYSRREEYRGFTQDFKEKDHYKPDVKIEYVDESGRKLTPKEAFRQLSHRFHGKGSGKMKTERRMKKLEEEALLKKMSSSDTPLGTVALLQEKQKSQKTPYIVLSGSGKSMNANTITK
ncbi:U4/U6.U5 tri-snRNP-associated protein 1 [Rhinichthys klamathensis goyatoka]|uniref:U4/U6.U5 tri-snRNP-associated protein 1 n=1 Tax=Rhinichthys klamathensis goyatoka TaxID=3034132 RepID=UPI0024B5AED0|nr:U4/U6.U5 tri-snRNP-associated protein 1 [Rhinichthys klamathensis goyatoka]